MTTVATAEGPFPWNNAEPVASPAPGPYDGTHTTAIPGAAQTYQEAGPFLDLPVVQVFAIDPDTGSVDGGLDVDITVSDSAQCTGATVNGVALTSFFIGDHTHVGGVTGAGMSMGAGDVTVTNTKGTGTGVGLFTGT